MLYNEERTDDSFHLSVKPNGYNNVNAQSYYCKTILADKYAYYATLRYNVAWMLYTS